MGIPIAVHATGHKGPALGFRGLDPAPPFGCSKLQKRTVSGARIHLGEGRFPQVFGAARDCDKRCTLTLNWPKLDESPRMGFVPNIKWSLRVKVYLFHKRSWSKYIYFFLMSDGNNDKNLKPNNSSTCHAHTCSVTLYTGYQVRHGQLVKCVLGKL